MCFADQWHRLPPGVPHLVVYTAFFYFSSMFFCESSESLLLLRMHPLNLS